MEDFVYPSTGIPKAYPTLTQVIYSDTLCNMGRTSGWLKKTKEETEEIFRFAEGYKRFLDGAKTEREAVSYIENRLTSSGFSTDHKGERIISINRGKSLMAFVKGEAEPSRGLRIIVAHLDAPRLDLKQNPLYEDIDLALLKTHYYGGIKKYQWVATPLALHGVVIKKDGRRVDVIVGEKEDDPVFAIDDLLPHLSRTTQEEKKLREAIEGEKLTLLFGSIPLLGAEKEGVKRAVLKLLSDKYGIEEGDFISAEIEVVPAFKARDVGIDRSMIGAYGQDDRACVYPLLEAICSIDRPSYPCLAIFTDKEEIGSEGTTGIQSAFLQVTLNEILEGMGIGAHESTLRRILFHSKAISADVNGPVNPDYQEVHEKYNACYLGFGICLSKYTGHGGKVGASDANAEFVGEIRHLFDREHIVWQTGEMGKIDIGGGGTVAKFLALHGMDIVDCGPPILSMHSPFEISSKLDIYETFRAYKAFFNF
ncbi:MAG: aminopeptidase [Syntrophorhabdaceae bacterium]|nr:aminopeptidase [Syntrophorhabdaceae bacterium]